MTNSHLVALILGLTGMGLSFVANLFFAIMIGEINGNPERRMTLGPLGIDVVQFVRIWNEHRRLYPSSRVPTMSMGSFLMGVTLFVGAVGILLWPK